MTGEPPFACMSGGRRRALTALGLTGATALSGRAVAQIVRTAANGASPPACVLTPAQTEGPFFVDERLDRSDIRSDPSDANVPRRP